MIRDGHLRQRRSSSGLCDRVWEAIAGCTQLGDGHERVVADPAFLIELIVGGKSLHDRKGAGSQVVVRCRSWDRRT